MRNFTGYEPNAAGDPSGSRGSGSQPLMDMNVQAPAAASAALVPLPQDTIEEDLNNISMTSLQDFLEDDGPLVAAPLSQSTLVLQDQSPTSTMPFVIVPQQSVPAGGDSFASNAFQQPKSAAKAPSIQHLVPRDLAVQALEQQRSTFEGKAKEYETYARDICQTEVAQSNASIEAAALSHINAQQAELNNAQNVVTTLRGSLGEVEQIAQNEYSQNQRIRDLAVAELASQKATSEQSENQKIDHLRSLAQS